MAEHIYLNENEKITPTVNFLASTEHLESAEIGQRLLNEFPEHLEVRDIQVPKDKLYTCWYVSVINYPKLPIINFTLQRNNALNVEFRYMQFINPVLRDTLQWATNNWVYARIKTGGYTFNYVHKIMIDYVPKCVNAVSNNNLKRGGTSAAEIVIDDILDVLIKEEVIQGSRPEWLRNQEGNLLQLDFLINHLKIAIEVQGPHHNKDFFGKPKQLARRQENDIYKINKCIENDLSLIWMDSEGIQKKLARLSFTDQKEIIQNLLQSTNKNHPCHIIWSSPEEPFEIKKELE